MKSITKKRLKAILIDGCISNALSFGAELLLRKKVKNEAVYIALYTASQYGLEYVQLKNSGQTVGYKLMGIKLESQDGSELTNKQILKRMLHRDTTSTLSYFKDRNNFEVQEGAILPHDERTGTIVREISN